MRNHWEIAWTSLQPLSDDEVEQAVACIARLGCSLSKLSVESNDSLYVAVRHREDDEFLLEFGFAEHAPCCTGPLGEPSSRGLVEDGQIAWNWCCTGRSQPETGLLIHKLRQVQAILADKLLVWDDDGQTHWSWGTCPIEQTGLDPMAVVDGHLQRLPPDRLLARAS